MRSLSGCMNLSGQKSNVPRASLNSPYCCHESDLSFSPAVYWERCFLITPLILHRVRLSLREAPCIKND
jgi:hypothetical protein